MGMGSEFREFAMRGNVVDLAVGVVIGAAFGKIVTALVDKVIMPPLGLAIGGIDLSDWAITLRAAAIDAAGDTVPAVVIGVGEFLNALLQFTIIAFAIFLLVRAINRLNREPASDAGGQAAEPSEEVRLLREIRDQLRAR